MSPVTKTINGVALTADKFAYVGNAADTGTWHLPVDSKGNVDSSLNAFAQTDLPESAKIATARCLAAKAKAMGCDATSFMQQHLGSNEHADFNGDWVQIFRTGDYGAKGKFTADDLDRVVRNYDPNFHEAPACVGHPKDNTPAFGWADRLMRQGDTLMAKFKQVDPAFEEAVRAGRFKKRSAAFYLDDQGQITNLRHVGFLGGQPPEVKGLKNLNFQDADRRFVEFGEEGSVSDTEKNFGEQLMVWLREHMPGMSGAREAKTFSENDLNEIINRAVTAATKPLQDQVVKLQGDLATQSTQFSESQALQTSKGRAAAAVARLKSKQKWVPAYERMGLTVLFDELAASENTVEFGEGDKKKEISPLDLMVEFMEGLNTIVPAGRTVDPRTSVGARGVGPVSAGRGTSVDLNSQALNEKARSIQKESKISFSEALDRATSEFPELTVPGASAAAAV